ncbi:MAG: hypothetical protein H7122_16565 [Chitinophagaceae bacterium]|nr:hypothetical protein [Chitinophagaceae bacterium]
MKSFQIIKGIISGFLLCVFAIGITPKQVLHDVLTHHQHVQGKEKGTSWVSKDRFNCDDENLVAQSPFVEQHNELQIVLPSNFSIGINLFFTSYKFLHQFFFELRGPPSFA